jgi:replicative DNA helicase
MLSKRSTKANFSDLGKVPPQDIEIEKKIIGTALSYIDMQTYCIENLKTNYFYHPTHQIIFKTMLELKAKNKPIDILTVNKELNNAYAYEISEISSESIFEIMRIEYYIEVIKEMYVRRELINHHLLSVNKLYDQSNELNELLNETSKITKDLSSLKDYSENQNIIDLLELSIKRIEDACKKRKENKVVGIPSPYRDFNECTAGFHKTDFLILAARPGMGKTALALSITNHIAFVENYKVDFYSLEMSAEQLIDRLISLNSSVSLSKIRTGNVYEDDWKFIHQNLNKITNNLFIDETPALSINKFASKARKRKIENKTDMIIIDYLQLMKGDDNYKGNREAEISDISRGIKALAKELNVPILALSQLSRAVESRAGNKKPMLSDLRESGSLEQDADMVMFLYRPDYYGIEVDGEGNNIKGLAQIIISKHRNGPLETIKIRFKGQNASFVDIDEETESHQPKEKKNKKDKDKQEEIF